jgi:hypothetical protein
MSLPSDPSIGTQMQTGSAADGFIDLRMSSGRMMAVSLGLLTRGTVARKVSSPRNSPPSPAGLPCPQPDRSVTARFPRATYSLVRGYTIVADHGRGAAGGRSIGRDTVMARIAASSSPLNRKNSRSGRVALRCLGTGGARTPNAGHQRTPRRSGGKYGARDPPAERRRPTLYNSDSIFLDSRTSFERKARSA